MNNTMQKQNIVLATNNLHKVEEIKAVLADEKFNLLTLKEVGIVEDIPETAPTLEGNAQLKAQFVAQRLAGQGYIVCADDTGLEVDSLDGAPGVFSARYSGTGTEGNIAKLLEELLTKDSRAAQFRTAICLITPQGTPYFFEGIVRGEILHQRAGIDGFGYDPIFKAEGCDKSFAEMNMQDKNAISHRGRAVRAMAEWLSVAEITD